MDKEGTLFAIWKQTEEDGWLVDYLWFIFCKKT